ncbi:AtpZ/AtpI family protein [Rhodopirellula sp. SWK7]|uniref:AtpZ/AtpI family protein n=1 Tax=Rhodopirellula sp. SWK7 TaxID=595460 RepID=UPI0002BD8061|nr:AtpZ/AtpI family protein [Rhodopirellula sp. SWK7]EMI43914.1 putative membrane protein [Rhodopirellula sp. SWK7]
MPSEPDEDKSEPEQNHPDGDAGLDRIGPAIGAPTDDAGDDHRRSGAGDGQTNTSVSRPVPRAMPPQTAGERQALMHLASAGFELASFSLILGGAGYGVDHWLGNSTPYFAIAGLLLGFSLGFYRLIVLASKMG